MWRKSIANISLVFQKDYQEVSYQIQWDTCKHDDTWNIQIRSRGILQWTLKIVSSVLSFWQY